MKTLNLMIIAIFLAVVIQACNTSTADVNKIPLEVLPVKTINLEVMNVNQSIQTSGQFTTEDEAILSFKTGGIINKIYVKEGDAVKKGQLLATVNSTELNSGAEQSKLGYEKAQRNYKRISNLYQDSVATLEQFQNAKTELDIAAQKLKTVNYNKDQNFIRANR
ncbi:MAG: efflux transporter periplasmic adaptor subunit, partial [Daejeonella sp.]|nr:efflux transporter periplasmic adaptor subunit [Daejeonella sp.]